MTDEERLALRAAKIAGSWEVSRMLRAPSPDVLALLPALPDGQEWLISIAPLRGRGADA